jgi:predicted esterase
MKCVPDIVYHPQHRLSLDFYVPDTLLADACVIYMHGGGFRKGSKADPEVIQFAERLTDSGYAVASINYRLRAKVDDVLTVAENSVLAAQERARKIGLSLSDTLYGPSFYAAVEDLSVAINFLKSEADALGLGTDKIGVLGLSAGGIAALSTVFIPRNMEDFMTSPDAVVTIASALVQPWRMRADGAPCLLINGRRDRTIGIDNARLALDRATAIGAPFQLVETGVKGHMTQVETVLDKSTPDGTPYFDLILSHFETLKAAG